MKYRLTSLIAPLLIISGITCLLLFHQADHSIDNQGILQEPFALLGGGYFLLGSGLLTGLTQLLKRLLDM